VAAGACPVHVIAVLGVSDRDSLVFLTDGDVSKGEVARLQVAMRQHRFRRVESHVIGPSPELDICICLGRYTEATITFTQYEAKVLDQAKKDMLRLRAQKKG
jgi:hypothetical protein